jgi:two-component system response regulator NreC
MGESPIPCDTADAVPAVYLSRMRTRILLVSDYPAGCRRLRRLLEGGRDVRVSGEAHTVEEATDLIDKCRPDAAIVCIELGAADGIALAGRIARHNGVLVLVISIHDESIYAERALRAGARGYVMKGRDSGAVFRAIDTVASGDIYVSDRMKNVLIPRVVKGKESPRCSDKKEER